MIKNLNPVEKYIYFIEEIFNKKFLELAILEKNFIDNNSNLTVQSYLNNSLKETESFIIKNKEKIKTFCTFSPNIWSFLFKTKLINCLEYDLYYIQFYISDKFNIKTEFKYRKPIFYYHGRVLNGKINLKYLVKLLDTIKRYDGCKIVLRGPITKKYWVDEELKSKEHIEFKKELIYILEKYYSKIDILDEIKHNDENRELNIANELNNYKYYLSLSQGESFSVSLLEALSCGNIPVVMYNVAYDWADGFFVKNYTIEDLVEFVKYLIKNDKEKENYLNEISIQTAKYFNEKFSYDYLKRKNIDFGKNFFKCSDNYENDTSFEEDQINKNLKFVKAKIPTFYEIITKNKSIEISYIENIDFKTLKDNLEFLKKYLLKILSNKDRFTVLNKESKIIVNIDNSLNFKSGLYSSSSDVFMMANSLINLIENFCYKLENDINKTNINLTQR